MDCPRTDRLKGRRGDEPVCLHADTVKRLEWQQAAILDNIPHATWLKDRESRYIAVNASYARLCGRAPADIVGKTDLDLWPSDLAERFRAGDAEVIRTGRPLQTEEVILDHSGRHYWVEKTKTPIRGDCGKIIGTIGIASDITERKRIQEITQANLQFLQVIIDAMSSPIFYKNTAGLYTGCNRAFAAFLGRPKDEIIGRSVYDLVPAAQAELSHKADEELLRHGGTQVYETKAYRADGAERDVVFHKAAYGSTNGRVDGLVGIMIDVTDQRRLEGELADHREHLHRAERLASIGTLAATFAHQINQPLTAIRLFLQQSLRALEKVPCPPLVMSNLKDTLAEVSNAIYITNHFLHFARRRPEAPAAEVDLCDAVKRTCAVLAPSARRNQVELTSTLPNDLPRPRVSQCDLEQVLFVLIQNAIQAAPGSRPCRVTVGGTGKAGCLELEVADTCDGIAPENLGRIFDPFFTTKPAGKGTGLGLSILQRIVVNGGGTVHVDSQPGMGTVFRVNLPASAK